MFHKIYSQIQDVLKDVTYSSVMPNKADHQLEQWSSRAHNYSTPKAWHVGEEHMYKSFICFSFKKEVKNSPSFKNNLLRID